jgi:4-amino-4-deoxy-L-arabinose transferase-like glycosyltransferase
MPLLLVAVAAIGAHAWQLATIPRGLHVDEVSIGYNAWLVATSGRDEHGVEWPLYFRAFGEYKNPIHIYVLAAIYSVSGLSVAATRAASAVAWLLGSLVLYDLCRRLTRDTAVRLYAAICLGFTPWLFVLSRISYEVIWLYPLLAVHLWAVHATCERGRRRWAVVAGIALGLSAYAYSTFRLLAPLQALAVVVAYPQREYWRRHALTLATFGLALLPLAAYLFAHPDALTARFAQLTWLHEPGWSPGQRIGAFAGRYIGYFSPDFLALHGDANPRHHTGVGGELLLATAGLAFAGFVLALRRRAAAFERVLVLGVLVAPVAASLTRDYGHSLRAFSMVVPVILLSVVAASALRRRFGATVAAALAFAAAIQATAYAVDYFRAYPQRSIAAFEGYDFETTARVAQERARGRVVVDAWQNQPYVRLLFERALHPADRAAPSLVLGTKDNLSAGDEFVIYDPAFLCSGCRAGLPSDGLYGIVDAPSP